MKEVVLKQQKMLRPNGVEDTEYVLLSRFGYPHDGARSEDLVVMCIGRRYRTLAKYTAVVHGREETLEVPDERWPKVPPLDWFNTQIARLLSTKGMRAGTVATRSAKDTTPPPTPDGSRTWNISRRGAATEIYMPGSEYWPSALVRQVQYNGPLPVIESMLQQPLLNVWVLGENVIVSVEKAGTIEFCRPQHEVLPDMAAGPQSLDDLHRLAEAGMRMYQPPHPR